MKRRDRALGKLVGARCSRGSIDFLAADPRAVQVNAPGSDEIADGVQVALRIGTQIVIEQHQHPRLSECRLPSLELRRVAAQIRSFVDPRAPIFVEVVVHMTALQSEQPILRIESRSGLAKRHNYFAVWNV